MARPSSSISPPSSSLNEGNGGSFSRSRPPVGSIFSGKFFPVGNNDVATSSGAVVTSKITTTTTTKAVKPPPPTPKGQVTAVATKPAPKKVTSFAEVAKRSSPSRSIRSSWAQTRAMTKALEVMPAEQASPLVYTHHPEELTVAVRYDRRSTPVTDVISAIAVTLKNTIAGMDFSSAGTVFVLLDNQENYQSALASPIPFKDGPLKALPVKQSLGTRLTIRVDNLRFMSPEERLKFAKETFGLYGNVLGTRSHTCTARGFTFPLQSFDILLELPRTTSKDLLLPRVVDAHGSNVLFTWSGVPVCFRCGEGSHLKTQCPKPLDYDLSNAPAVTIPIMARAFPPRDAPLRATPTKAQTTPVQAKTVTTLSSKSSSSAPSVPAPTQDTTWTVVEAKSRRKRLTSGHISDSEASRVELGFKPKKPQRSKPPPPSETQSQKKAVAKGPNPKTQVRKSSAMVNDEVEALTPKETPKAAAKQPSPVFKFDDGKMPVFTASSSSSTNPLPKVTPKEKAAEVAMDMEEDQSMVDSDSVMDAEVAPAHAASVDPASSTLPEASASREGEVSTSTPVPADPTVG